MINKDFKNVLKTEEYPQISLRLKEINQADTSKNLNVLVNLQMAGLTKPYHIPVEVIKTSKETLLIKGGLNISLKDYNLESTKKLFGLITIEDNIEIDFSLIAREVSL